LRINLDPDQKSALNFVNVTHSHGHLIVEPICDHPPSGDDAKTACTGFASSISAPIVGNHIRITGSYVTDLENGWNEIHPVSRLDLLP